MNWIHEEGRIYSEDETGKVLAEAIYTNKPNGEIDVEHVYVDPSLRGQGIAEKVMYEVVNYVIKNGKKATATCAYANSWFQKHKEEYKDILSSVDNAIMACRIDGRH